MKQAFKLNSKLTLNIQLKYAIMMQTALKDLPSSMLKMKNNLKRIT
jgi:hypothetical protein